MSTPFSFDRSQAVVADVETYPEQWCVGFHGPDTTGRRVTGSDNHRTRKSG